MNVEQNSEVSTPWLVFSSMTGVCQFLVDFHRCCQNPAVVQLMSTRRWSQNHSILIPPCIAMEHQPGTGRIISVTVVRVGYFNSRIVSANKGGCIGVCKPTDPCLLFVKSVDPPKFLFKPQISVCNAGYYTINKHLTFFDFWHTRCKDMKRMVTKLSRVGRLRSSWIKYTGPLKCIGSHSKERDIGGFLED